MTEKNLGGRPEIVLNEEQIEKVGELASYLTIEQMADYLGICRNTFAVIRERQPEVFAQYKKGRASKIVKFAQKLEEKALGIVGERSLDAKEVLNADSACLMFYLKTQAGWRETQVVETKDTTPQKRFILEVDSGTAQD